MVDAWPGTLPQRFRYPTYHREVGDGRLRVPTDTGPAKVRGRSSAVVDVITGTMTMTLVQWNALQVFGATTLIRWSLPFTFPDPDDVNGLTALLVRFGDKLPTRDPITQDRLSVALTLEALP